MYRDPQSFSLLKMTYPSTLVTVHDIALITDELSETGEKSEYVIYEIE